MIYGIYQMVYVIIEILQTMVSGISLGLGPRISLG